MRDCEKIRKDKRRRERCKKKELNSSGEVQSEEREGILIERN